MTMLFYCYHTQNISHKTDINQTWTTINETLNRNNNKCVVLSRFLHNGVELLDLKDIANTFNII